MVYNLVYRIIVDRPTKYPFCHDYRLPQILSETIEIKARGPTSLLQRSRELLVRCTPLPRSRGGTANRKDPRVVDPSQRATPVTPSTVNNLGTQLKGTSRAPTTLTFINKPRMDERRSEKWLVGSGRERGSEGDRKGLREERRGGCVLVSRERAGVFN